MTGEVIGPSYGVTGAGPGRGPEALLAHLATAFLAQLAAAGLCTAQLMILWLRTVPMSF